MEMKSVNMALAEYTPQPHKFNRFNKNGLFGRDRHMRIVRLLTLKA